ncbi:MotE family protein [Sporolactobacillus pectinivorans]|uniref:MotE family protein n=1 Tax=Sporolactobacillus pectinivorans TaxID=1591408 RepID=UPI000C257946|nr:hypothetical protein [Sporolactobacillus pectinivorans]
MDEKKKSRFGIKLLKFFLALLIPILFLLLLTGLFLKLSGIDPVSQAKALIFGKGVSPAVQTSGVPASTSPGLKQQIANQNATIKSLQNDNNQKSDQIAQLQNQLKQAQNQANQQNQTQKSQNSAALQTVYSQTYKNMDPTKAAAIFGKLPVKQAANYINMLDDATKASILENMTPTQAAAITQLLKAPQNTNSSATITGSSSSTSVSTTIP